jgi:uncharacterized protein YheU (UPF0270 family)
MFWHFLGINRGEEMLARNGPDYCRAPRRITEERRNMKRNLAHREIVLTLAEAAEVIGISRMSLFRYQQYLPDFPSLPTFKMALRWWAERHGLPRRRGPLPSFRQKQVVYMHGGLKQSFTEIARELGISVQAAAQLWKRHARKAKPLPAA